MHNPLIQKKMSNLDRKFIYGIDECPKVSSKSDRLDLDLCSVVSVVSKIDGTIQSQDCFCLDKFSPLQKQPRPILVKFIRIADVSTVLKKGRRVLTSPISIKPGMLPEERRRESGLLRERWSLIQSGIPRGAIRIRGSHLNVHNKFYGQYRNSVFELLTYTIYTLHCV